MVPKYNDLVHVELEKLSGIDPRFPVLSGLTVKQPLETNARLILRATDSDEVLVARYRESRDNSALEELVKRHVPKVRAMIFQMVLDDNVADDLTQETLLRAVRGIDSFEGRSQFGTWLYRIAMNTAYSYLDRRNRSPVLFQTEVMDRSRCDVEPDRLAMETELRHKIESAIAALSPKLRAAIVLTGLQGLSARQASAIENCSEATIHSRVHEARKQLKQQLRDYLP